MNGQGLCCILGICALVAGCSPIASGVRTMILEPLEYCTNGDAICSRVRYRRLAEAAWDEIAKANPELGRKSDYAVGFKDGYADYLFEGGAAAPPPLPPRHYWKEKYRTPQGQEAIADWFAGYQSGAAAAQGSGLRDVIVIPTWGPPMTMPPDSGPLPAGKAPEPEPSEALPSPRPISSLAPTPVPAEARPGPTPVPAEARRAAQSWMLKTWSDTGP
jgi:hypothetical protein